MPAYKVVILEHTITEIAESCSYYNKQLPGPGFEFEEDVFLLIELIKNNPLLFPIKFVHVHEAIMTRFPFVINYEILGRQIIISAVFHTKQHPDKKVKRNRK